MPETEEEKAPLLVNSNGAPPYNTTAMDNQSTILGIPAKQIQQDVDVETKVYKRRWYIMLIYGLMAMTQCAVWNTFSPITEVGEHVFNWNTATLSLLTNWGPISYVVGTGIFSWILDEKGLRPACVISAFLVAAGTALRCISSEPSVATPLIHVGQFLNGLAGPIAMGGATAISSVWFPASERATATALATNLNVLGLAVSYLLGPYLVPVLKLHKNTTHSVNESFFYDENVFSDDWLGNTTNNHTGNITDTYDVAGERKEMMRYMYYSCGWSVFCFLCFFTYFPNKPPKPPSPSASQERTEFFTGVKHLARLIHVGQFLNGLAGPIAMGGATAISSVWFPASERATATALATNLNVLGLAVSYLLGPYLVPVLKLHKNTTHSVNESFFYDENVFSDDWLGNTTNNHTGNITDTYDVAGERKEMMRYMYYSCGWSVFCFLCFFTYFPNKPPKPPSPSASQERTEFFTGVKHLARNRTFWLICLTYGLPLGIFNCWNGVLDVNLKDHNISQKDAGWLGFYGVLAGMFSALVVARGADIFKKHLKTILVGLFVGGSAVFLIFSMSLVGLGAMPSTKAILYPTYIIANLLMLATVPMFFEAACEVTYPVAEGVTTLVLTLLNNIAGLVFLFVQMIPNIGTMWSNWCTLGGFIVCIPVLLTMRESYNRLDIDITVEGASTEKEGADNPALS